MQTLFCTPLWEEKPSLFASIAESGGQNLGIRLSKTEYGLESCTTPSFFWSWLSGLVRCKCTHSFDCIGGFVFIVISSRIRFALDETNWTKNQEVQLTRASAAGGMQNQAPLVGMVSHSLQLRIMYSFRYNSRLV
jgi:hypothetical protein